MESSDFKNQGVQISEEDIRLAEADLGVSLPSEFKKFLLSVSNGGVPRNAYWPVGDEEYLWLSRFLPIKDSLGRGRTIEETYRLGKEKAFLPDGFVVFAIDHGGNYFCLDQDARVYFFAMDAWRPDVEFSENGRHAKRFLADSLKEFLDGLEEEGY